MKFEIKNAEELFPEGTQDFTIPWENIEKVYEGQLNCCACGCGGDYYYTQHYCDYSGNDLLVSSDNLIFSLLTVMQESKRVGWMRNSLGYILEVELTSRGTDYGTIDEGIRVYFNTSAFEYTNEDAKHDARINEGE